MITEKLFGKTSYNAEIKEYVISNGFIEASVINYGGAVRYIKLADKNSVVQNVALGWNDVEGYENKDGYYGAFVGRYANRIKGSQFTLNGKTYHLTPNDGANHLHGTFSKRVMDSFVEGGKVVMKLISTPDEEGYPGTLDITVSYSLNDENGLVIEYSATTDEDTVVNFTNHSYFNLNGQNGKSIEEHILMMTADRFIPTNEQCLPTGEILTVDGTPFDMRNGIKIGDGLTSEHQQIRLHNTYDHSLVLPDKEGKRHFATAYCKDTGIKLDAFTTEPAVQLYVNPDRSAFCLEAQHYPASPNFDHFPTTVLKKGDVYKQITEYRFSVIK